MLLPLLGDINLSCRWPTFSYPVWLCVVHVRDVWEGLRRMSPLRFRIRGPGTVSFSWLSLWGGRAIISLDNSPILIPASRPPGLVSLAEKIYIQNITPPPTIYFSLFLPVFLSPHINHLCFVFPFPFSGSSPPPHIPWILYSILLQLSERVTILLWGDYDRVFYPQITRAIKICK